MEDDEYRLKLSHHPDGFVQFSGHGIKSGRNADGTPKGLGVFLFHFHGQLLVQRLGLTVMNLAGPTPRRLMHSAMEPLWSYEPRLVPWRTVHGG
jgi:hypothetical protein